MTGTRTDVPPVQGPPVATNRVASGPPDAPPGRKRRPEAFQSLDELDDFLDFTTDDDLSLEDFQTNSCLLYTSPSPRDGLLSRMPSSA